MTVASIGDAVSARSLAVVAGPGGVGKTTVSAALAIESARRVDRSVLVLTIDPARRLAGALGIEIDGNATSPVDLRDLSAVGRLDAAMLDPATAWDAMVRAETDSETADRIIGNPVYRRIADTFVHGNDYAALGWLEAAMASEEYDLIVVDTPPSQNALGLFDAPERVSEFFTSSLLGWLTKGESGRTIGGPAAKTFGVIADRLLGSQFFGDIVEFFQLMQTVVPGMVERTGRVAERLAGDDALFVAVSSPAERSMRAAADMSTDLASRGLGVDAVVVNGVEPDVFWSPKVDDVASRVLQGERSPFSDTHTNLLRPGADYVAQQVGVAKLQSTELDGIDAEIVATLPRAVHSPTSVPELAELGARLWEAADRRS